MKDRQRWQPEEDALLLAYVNQYGPKEWNLISLRMGPKTLHRDPKSCLERWKNYLKPGIKRGSLTPEEQTLVVTLQAKYGNKWKKIASEVPGRTAKRLGKWWEVFKEKQLKKSQTNRVDPGPVVSCCGSPEKALQGSYDHILETFAEKYVNVQPKFFAFQSSSSLPRVVMPSNNLSLPEPPPVLSLGSVSITEPVNNSSSFLPPWMMTATNVLSSTTSSLTSCSSSTTTTPSPSVSLTLSPAEPGVHDPVHQELGLQSRFLPVQQMGTLIQYLKELEEGKQNWVQHKKEATWRLNRLEQQLDSEKARKRREKMEEIEAKIRCLREEEMSFVCRIESEYREQLVALQRDAEVKEAKLMEALCGKHHAKLAKLVEQIGVVHSRHGFTQ